MRTSPICGRPQRPHGSPAFKRNPAGRIGRCRFASTEQMRPPTALLTVVRGLGVLNPVWQPVGRRVRGPHEAHTVDGCLPWAVPAGIAAWDAEDDAQSMPPVALPYRADVVTVRGASVS